MHRRSFVTALTAALTAALAAAPVMARFPGADSVVPYAARRFALPEKEFAWLTVEVQLTWSERIARGLRNREAHDPFDGLVGELYISDAQVVDIPDHLPGTITTYDTVVGVAAAKGTIHVGGFRRDTFVWTVRVGGGSVDYVVEAAEAIAGFELPDPTQVRLAPSLLHTLLPAPSDFSRPVKIATE